MTPRAPFRPLEPDGEVKATLLFRDNLELDFWAMVPAPLTEDVAGGWNEAIQHGLLLAGLSELVRRAADDSELSDAGLTTIQLVGLLERDLEDQVAQLDSKDDAGTLRLGTCTSLCEPGPSTMRGDYAEAIGSSLASSANTSGIGVTDARALTATPVVGAEVGVQHRFSQRFVVGVAATADVGRTASMLRLNLELSWLWC